MTLQKLRILHIVAAKTWGGGESCVLSMCKASQEKGHQVFVALDMRLSAFSERFEPWAEILLLPLQYPKAMLSVIMLRAFLKERNIDVIHTHSGRSIPLAAVAKAYLPTKLLSFRHNVLPNKQDVLHRFLYRHVDAFLCVSNAVYRAQVSSAGHALRRRFFCIHNGIDTAMYDRAHPTRPLRQGMLTIGYAGRIEKNKGLGTLLEAMAFLADERIRLRIAGDMTTSYAREMQSCCREHGGGDRVDWMGFQQDMCGFYDTIDVLVLPTLIPEAFGLVLCEAMYCRCPVIATNTGAQGEIVTDGKDGYLLPPGDVGRLANCLQNCLDHTEILTEMGNVGRDRVIQDFTMDVWVRRMEKIYAHVFDEYDEKEE